MRLFLRLENEQKSCAIWVHSFLEIALLPDFQRKTLQHKQCRNSLPSKQRESYRQTTHQIFPLDALLKETIMKTYYFLMEL